MIYILLLAEYYRLNEIMNNLLYKKKDGFYFSLNDFSRKGERNVPYQVLLLDKKATYKKGIDYAIANSIDKIEINQDLSEKELALLKNISLKGLSIRGIQSKVDISFLNELTGLEYLSINSPLQGEIDFSQLNKMISLNYDATNLNFTNIDKANNIKELYIYNYKKESLIPFGCR